MLSLAQTMTWRSLREENKCRLDLRFRNVDQHNMRQLYIHAIYHRKGNQLENPKYHL